MQRIPTVPVFSRSRALITGGAGFIGSHLAERLLEKGCEVVVLDDLSTGSIGNLAGVLGHPAFTYVRGSACDETLLRGVAAGCDQIYHLAAVVGVQLVLDDPLRVIEENILGTRAVLRAAVDAGARCFVASTSEIYGKNPNVPFTEESDRVLGPPTLARWSYSTSKAVDEILAFGYAERYGVPVVVTRFFNTIGARQTGQYGMVVPRFVEQACMGEPISVYGDGSQTRCFCDVRDVVSAVIGLMDTPAAWNRVYNIGSGHEISILGLARRVLATVAPERAGDPGAVRFIPYRQAYGAGYDEFPRRVPDTSRVRAAIGWEPTIPLEETLHWIAQAYQTAQIA